MVIFAADIATDPTPIVSVLIALSATVTAAFAYRRGRKVDDRTTDLDTLRQIVSTLQEDRDSTRKENEDQRTRLTQMSGRLDSCEREKDDLQRKVYHLQGEIYRLKEATSG